MHASAAEAPAPGTRPRRTVVLKFGGTSLADSARIQRAAARLVEAAAAGDRVVAVVSAVGDTTDRLLARAHALSSHPDPRELDMLLAVGEQMSCALLAIAVADAGGDAVSCTGGQAGVVTDGRHGRATIVDIRARRVQAELDRGRIVLVAGFQGVSSAAEITTLGRGGSDTSAVALAAALGADECEIFTDVDGVFTADPRVVPTARKLELVCSEDMLELAAAGAGVLQSRSVELAQCYGIDIHVRSSFSDRPGTHILDTASFERPVVTGIAHTRAEAVYRVNGARQSGLFRALAESGVNVDTIIQIDAEIVFSAPIADHATVAQVLRGLDVRWTERRDLGKVTVVGAGMKTHPGIASRLFETLAALGLEGQFVSTSPIKIACYVPAPELERTVQALHSAFGLEHSGL